MEMVEMKAAFYVTKGARTIEWTLALTGNNMPTDQLHLYIKHMPKSNS